MLQQRISAHALTCWDDDHIVYLPIPRLMLRVDSLPHLPVLLISAWPISTEARSCTGQKSKSSLRRASFFGPRLPSYNPYNPVAILSPASHHHHHHHHRRHHGTLPSLEWQLPERHPTDGRGPTAHVTAGSASGSTTRWRREVQVGWMGTTQRAAKKAKEALYLLGCILQAGRDALSSAGSADLLERALRAAGGVKAGGPPKTDPATGNKREDGVFGYMHMDAWDLLWSVTAKAALAADLLRKHQMLGIIPGLLAVSRKTTLVRSLRDLFGEAAWDIVPRSYKLPDELDEWGRWVAENPERDTGLWMLKNNKQRGTGLRLVRTSEAFTVCFETVPRPDLAPGVHLYRWYLAQQYVTKPLLIDSRKFGVRVWVLVSDAAPLRIYIHSRGLVLFSSHSHSAGPPPLGTTSNRCPRLRSRVGRDRPLLVLHPVT
ncbi:hypothetical protein Vretimale_16680 [Volvox reticuliferus]|uniref:Tubulin--tyrosine ligase-like protein 5 n=1 Tax=Volvox reticuliferus TaxID=1737510 RepID=A0A8J4GTP4_9CHLO|nr:hypothetical protein Vretimale_16680 [Volvox reticuliferus]